MISLKYRNFFTICGLLMCTQAINSCADARKETSAKSESPKQSKTQDALESGESMQVQFCAKTYAVEVVKSHALRSKGLMYRERVDPGKGMLFVFRAEQPLQFWMKNVSIPLDIVFFDSKGKVTKIHYMQAESPMVLDSKRMLYSSERPAQFALEVAGGTFTADGKALSSFYKCELTPLPKIDRSVE